MKKITEHPRFYALWIVAATLTVLLGFGYLGSTYSWWGFGVDQWSLLALCIVIGPVLLFEKLYVKAALVLGGTAIYFFWILSTLPGSVGLGIFAYLFAFGGMFLEIAALFAFEHFRVIKGVAALLVFELIAALHIVPPFLKERYRVEGQWNIVDNISEDTGHSTTDALEKCERITDNDTAKSACFKAIAKEQEDVEICGRIPRREYIEACIAMVANQTCNPSLCSDERIIDNLTRDFCWFDTGGIQSADDCQKLSVPFQREHCLRGGRSPANRSIGPDKRC